jgi:hypothetical protein
MYSLSLFSLSNFCFSVLKRNKERPTHVCIATPGSGIRQADLPRLCCKEMTVYFIRIIIRHSRWNTPDSFLRVTGCSVRLPVFPPKTWSGCRRGRAFLYSQREGGQQCVHSAAPVFPSFCLSRRFEG